MVRIRVKHTMTDHVDNLLKNHILVVDDGNVSRELTRILKPLRINGNLIVGRDGARGKSILLLNGDVNGRRRKKAVGFGIFLYDIIS